MRQCLVPHGKTRRHIVPEPEDEALRRLVPELEDEELPRPHAGRRGPAINIQFGNLKPFPKPAENGNANSEHLIAGVGSENLLNILNKPTGCHQSICSSILQNVRSSEISRNFSLAMPAFHTMGSSTHQGIVSTAAMQQKQHLSPQRCMVPLGDVMPQEQRHYLVPQGVELDSASKTHVNSQVSGSDEAPAEPEQKFQDHNTGDENRINLRRTESASLYESNNAQQSEMVYVALPTDSNKQSDDMIKTISHDILAENLDQLPKHQNVESFTSPFDHDDIADQISVKQGLQVKIQGHRKIVRQQSDPPGAQSPGLDATQSSDVSNLNNLLPSQDYLHHNLDHDEWIPQHSCVQSFMSSSRTPEVPCINDKPDSVYLSAVENAATFTSYISSLANPHSFEPIETFQLSCISDSDTSQHCTTNIQESLGTQLNSLNDELLVQGILSSEVHNLDVHGHCSVVQGMPNSCWIMDLSEESNNQSDTIGNLHFDPSNESMDMGLIPSVTIEGLSSIGSSKFCIASVMPVCSFNSNQEQMSKITSMRLTDSVSCLQDIPDCSTGTSSSSIAANDYSLYRGSRKQLCQQPLRTYAKVEYWLLKLKLNKNKQIDLSLN
ncbi:hypothetical protein GW17_00030263 [Ensete ventricosum]|nr:hypothetical protein GW17_00030263 [Ensete ventricosum]